MADVKIGKVTHFYNKIGVAIIELSAKLVVGETIKFLRQGKELFTQVVSSIQIEHQSVQEAKKGEIIGLKVDQPVKEGGEVYKVTV
jgi:putative protease